MAALCWLYILGAVYGQVNAASAGGADLFFHPDVEAALVLQDVDQDTQQYPEHIIHGSQGADGGAAGAAGKHLDRDLAEAECFALQDDQGLDFGVFEGKAAAKNLQGAAVDGGEAGGGVGDALAEDGVKDHGEQPSAEAAKPL